MFGINALWKGAVLGLVFVMLASAGFAEHFDSERTACDQILLDASAVDVSAGKEVFRNFPIVNFSAERFYADRAEVVAGSGFTAEAVSWTRTIEPGQAGNVTVKVKGIYSENSDGNANAVLELRGHFQNSETCTFDELNKDFIVYVKQEQANLQKSCSDFELVVPEKTEVNGEGTVKFYVNNLLFEPVNLRFTGTETGVETNFLTVPERTQKYYELAVRPETGKEWLVFNSYVQGCSYPSQTTEIINSGGSSASNPEQETDVISQIVGQIVQPSAEQPIEPETGTIVSVPSGSPVEIMTVTKGEGDKFEITADFLNKSNESLSGTVSLVVPRNWKVEGIESLNLSAGEKKTMNISIAPDKALGKEILAELVVEYGNARQSKLIPLMPKSDLGLNAPGVGLIGLGEGAVLFALFLILALVGFEYYEHERRKRLDTARQEPEERPLVHNIAVPSE